MFQIGIDDVLVLPVDPKNQPISDVITGTTGEVCDQQSADAMPMPIGVDVELVELAIDLL